MASRLKRNNLQSDLTIPFPRWARQLASHSTSGQDPYWSQKCDCVLDPFLWSLVFSIVCLPEECSAGEARHSSIVQVVMSLGWEVFMGNLMFNLLKNGIIPRKKETWSPQTAHRPFKTFGSWRNMIFQELFNYQTIWDPILLFTCYIIRVLVVEG